MKVNRLTSKSIIAIVLAFVMVGVMAYTALPAYAEGGTITITLSGNFAQPYPAEEGDYVTELTSASEFDGFTFGVYKVAHFEGTSFVLDKALSDEGISHTFDISNPDEYTETDPTWTNAWLQSASSLASKLSGKTELMSSIKVGGDKTGIKPGDSFSQKVGVNGLYLVMGSKERVGNFDWEPVPMFVMILNKDQQSQLATGTFDTAAQKGEVIVKMLRSPAVSDHRVTKVWPTENADPRLQPSEVKVNVMFNGKSVDVVTLNADNNWSFAWKVDETLVDANKQPLYRYYEKVGKDEDPVATVKLNADNDYGRTSDKDKQVTFSPAAEQQDPAKNGWKCVEILSEDDYKGITKELTGEEIALTDAERTAMEKNARNFIGNPETTPAANQDAEELIKINNVVELKKLKITKNIQQYMDAGQNVTIAYEIICKDEKGNPVLTNYAGITITPDDINADGSCSKDVTVTGIPANAKTIQVTEVYSGNYTAAGGEVTKTLTYEKDFDADEAQWEVSYDNNMTGHNPSDGVVNKYEYNKDKKDFDARQEGLGTEEPKN